MSRDLLWPLRFTKEQPAFQAKALTQIAPLFARMRHNKVTFRFNIQLSNNSPTHARFKKSVPEVTQQQYIVLYVLELSHFVDSLARKIYCSY